MAVGPVPTVVGVVLAGTVAVPVETNKKRRERGREGERLK